MKRFLDFMLLCDSSGFADRKYFCRLLISLCGACSSDSSDRGRVGLTFKKLLRRPAKIESLPSFASRALLIKTGWSSLGVAWMTANKVNGKILKTICVCYLSNSVPSSPFAKLTIFVNFISRFLHFSFSIPNGETCLSNILYIAHWSKFCDCGKPQYMRKARDGWQ